MPFRALDYEEEVLLIPDPQGEKEIRGFLLGEVEVFSKEWTDDEIELVEEELVDQYVRCELIPDEKRRFESHYLSRPGNRRKLEFASSLHRKLAKPRRTWIGAAIGGSVAASIAVAGIISWKLATVTLYPGAIRDASSAHRTIGRVISRPVRLALIDPLQPGTFRAVLKSAEGTEVWNAIVQVEPEAQYVGVTLPARDIEPGDYVIEIQFPESKTAAAVYTIQVR